MNALDFKLEYQQNNDKSSITMPVVIVAAGSSLRMQGINKQLVTLCGVPAIAHTLMAFQQSQYISQIILVTKKEFIADMQSLATKYAVTKLTDIVAGGDSRCKSVLNGLECVKNNKYVKTTIERGILFSSIAGFWAFTVFIFSRFLRQIHSI